MNQNFWLDTIPPVVVLLFLGHCDHIMQYTSSIQLMCVLTWFSLVQQTSPNFSIFNFQKLCAQFIWSFVILLLITITHDPRRLQNLQKKIAERNCNGKEGTSEEWSAETPLPALVYMHTGVGFNLLIHKLSGMADCPTSGAASKAKCTWPCGKNPPNKPTHVVGVTLGQIYMFHNASEKFLLESLCWHFYLKCLFHN